MRVIIMLGSHPRHNYVAQQLINTGNVVGYLVEQRENFVPSPPAHLDEQDKQNFIRHFRDRDQSEHAMFPASVDVPEHVSVRNVTIDQLNSTETIEWISSLKADLLISYGVHKLSDQLLAQAPAQAWNIHGGLSPWYRGTTTLFWPFYMLQPNWAGMTVHKLSSKLDAGDILHHAVPELSYGDGIHDVANKAVKQVAEDLYYILTHMQLDELSFTPQKSAGKLFLSSEWKPEHLRVIYQLFNNDIVDHFLDGKLPKVDPPLVRAF